MLGVSRGSVREGLTILETEGLISRGWHRGTRVIDVTTEDVIEVYAVRAALDRLAATTARENASPQDLADLRTVVDAMAEALRREASGAELVGLDIAFHDLIYRSAGNQRLSAAWRAIRFQIHLFQLRRAERSDHDYRARVVLEHRRFVTLLSSGTEEEVGREAEEHVHAARETLLNDLGDNQARR